VWVGGWHGTAIVEIKEEDNYKGKRYKIGE